MSFKPLCAFQTGCNNTNPEHREKFYHHVADLCVFGEACTEKDKCAKNNRVHFVKQGEYLIIGDLKVKTMAPGYKPGRRYDNKTEVKTDSKTEVKVDSKTDVKTDKFNNKYVKSIHKKSTKNSDVHTKVVRHDIVGLYERSKDQGERTSYVLELMRRVEANNKRNEIYNIIIDDFIHKYPHVDLSASKSQAASIKQQASATTESVDNQHKPKSWADVAEAAERSADVANN